MIRISRTTCILILAALLPLCACKEAERKAEDITESTVKQVKKASRDDVIVSTEEAADAAGEAVEEAADEILELSKDEDMMVLEESSKRLGNSDEDPTDELLPTNSANNLDPAEFDLIFDYLETKTDLQNHEATDMAEAYKLLENDIVFQAMSEGDKCKSAYRAFKKTNCNVPKKKWIKQIIRKVGSGGFSVEDNSLVFPGWTTYRNEVNRLNVLIELLHDKRVDFCQNMALCERADYTYMCLVFAGREIPKSLDDRYQHCTTLIKTNNDLTRSLTNIGAVLNQFQDGNTDAATVKSVLGSEITELEEQESEETSEEESDQN